MALMTVHYRYKKNGVVSKKLKKEIAEINVGSGMILLPALEQQLKEWYGYEKVTIEVIKIIRSKKEGRI